MTGLSFIVYMAISLELVLGEYGIENNEYLYHVAVNQDAARYHEYQNISELPKERSETIQKSFSIPKALAISGSILAIPILGYTVYHRRNQKKQEIALDKSEITEETNKVNCNLNRGEIPESALDQSQTIEETSEANYNLNGGETQEAASDTSESTEETLDEYETTGKMPQVYFWKGLFVHELPIIQQAPKLWPFGYFDGMKPAQDQPMIWEDDTGTTNTTFGYPQNPTGNLKVEDLNSSISVKWPKDIYSTKVYRRSSFPFISARRFGIPPYRKTKGYSDKDAFYIEHAFSLEQKDEYLKKFKEVYGSRFHNVESKSIDDMIDDLFRDKGEVAIGKIKTNLPVGFAVKTVTESWTGRDGNSLIVCAHDFDENTGETIVSLAYRGDSHPESVPIPTQILHDLPEHMLKNALRTFAHIILKTIPEKKDMDLIETNE